MQTPSIFEFLNPPQLAATAIGSVKATDADTGKNAEVEYRIIDGDGTDMFDIITEKDTQEGIITVKKVQNSCGNNHLFVRYFCYVLSIQALSIKKTSLSCPTVNA